MRALSFCHTNQVQKYSILKLFHGRKLFFKGIILLSLTWAELLFTGGLMTFSRVVKRFDGWKSQGEIFFAGKMVPSICVRSSLDLGRVSSIFTISWVYRMINSTLKTLLDSVCVSSVICPGSQKSPYYEPYYEKSLLCFSDICVLL